MGCLLPENTVHATPGTESNANIIEIIQQPRVPVNNVSGRYAALGILMLADLAHCMSVANTSV